MNTLGKHYRITSIGESHGQLVSVVIDGCPAGHKLDMEQLQADLDRRRPGQSTVTTQRREQDKAEVFTGLYNGVTTGAPITIITRNTDRDSTKYHEQRWTPRPGHADYTAGLRYGEHQDPRGGGRFSGRNTIGFVMAGAVAKQVLTCIGTNIIGYTHQIGNVVASEPTSYKQIEENIVRCPDMETAEKMIHEIEAAQSDDDSVGGKVRCTALNPPRGIGDPVFDTLEGDLAKAFFSIPAVKAVEFGSGVESAGMRGSMHNDQYVIQDGEVVTKTNHCGGILGGISTGMPITATVTFKPTPSISKPQQTVDLRTKTETIIKITGRHDPCIVPRAVPVVEAMMAIVLLDHVLGAGIVSKVKNDDIHG